MKSLGGCGRIRSSVGCGKPSLETRDTHSRDVRGVGGVDFISNDRLAVVDNNSGSLRLFTIDPVELLEIARARVTRGHTETECKKYNIDPCPTLEEIRTG